MMMMMIHCMMSEKIVISLNQLREKIVKIKIILNEQ